MGRRQAAPQPLSLPGDAPSTTTTTTTSPDPIDDSHPYSKPSSSSALTSPDDCARNPRPAAFSSASSLQVVSPASSSKSSPRSPLSKFNAAWKPHSSSSSPPHTSDLTSPSQSDYFAQSPNTSIPKSSAGLYPTTSVTSQGSNTSHNHRHPDEHSEKHTRNGSRFFSFSKSSSKPHLHHSHTDSSNDSTPRSIPSRPSTARISRPTAADPSSIDRANPKLAHPLPSPAGDFDYSNTFRRNKPKPFALPGNSNSKDKDGSSPHEAPGTSSLTATTPSATINIPRTMEPERADYPQPLRNARTTIEGLEPPPRPMMNPGNSRTHSADRAAQPNKEIRKEKDKDTAHHGHKAQHSTVKESGSSHFLGGLRSSGTRAVEMVSRGFFTKGNRSASTNDGMSAVDDEHYTLKVINKPLIFQTRLTRISKRLEDSRDKTEFWMPAFPWRAIDYLNFKGCEVEGLYRVPGSAQQVKKWQRKFDEEYDVDLFAQDDLYDINIIGSMLKTWLRELPDELFPKEIQDKVSRECAGSEEVPKLLIDELANLPPFNYYLLFAITCHLSLLLAHSDKNKMDFRNLCICFQPCMKIDAFCFKFLVCEWRSCWQGCKSEARYIEEEYKLFDQSPPPGLRPDSRQRSPERSPQRNGAASPYDRSHSTDSSRQRVQNDDSQQQNGKLRKKPITPDPSNNGTTPSTPSNGTNSLTVDGGGGRNGGQDKLPPLSPIKPLSPMNF